MSDNDGSEYSVESDDEEPEYEVTSNTLRACSVANGSAPLRFAFDCTVRCLVAAKGRAMHDALNDGAIV